MRCVDKMCENTGFLFVNLFFSAVYVSSFVFEFCLLLFQPFIYFTTIPLENMLTPRVGEGQMYASSVFLFFVHFWLYAVVVSVGIFLVASRK